MIKSAVKKAIFSMILVVLILLGVGQNMVFAVTEGPISIKATEERYLKDSNGVYQKKNSYKIRDAKLYQIAKYSGDTILATNFYCLNGTVHAGDTYQRGYDMVTETSAISGLEEVYKNTVDSKIYKQVMWILDHMYVDSGNDEIDTETGIKKPIRELLSDAKIVYAENTELDGDPKMWLYDSDEKYYDPDYGVYRRVLKWYWGHAGYVYIGSDGQMHDVVLSQEEVEAVQEAALWYFTNYTLLNDNTYNAYVSENEKILADSNGNPSENGTLTNLRETKIAGSWFDFAQQSITGDAQTDQDIQRKKQEQAAILYNYLVDGAKKAAENNYDTSAEGKLNIAYKSEQKVVQEGTNYVVGPLVVTTTGTVNNIAINVTSGTSGVTAKLRNSSGTEITKVTPSEDFYVVVPKASVNENMTIKATGDAILTKKTLWVSTTGTYQPIVEVKKEDTPLEASVVAPITKQFDLALRKKIVAVNGKSTETDIINENKMDARREINISSSTPITYNHRKDPVVVKTGDKLTYRMYVYNEGEIDGYASKIIDTLPSGLKVSSTMGTSVQSNKRNTYSVGTTQNQIVLTLTSATPTAINAYSGTLDFDYVDVECEVTQLAETDGKTNHYLSNIAYISEAKDKSGNVVTDFDSTANNTNTSNGSNGLNVTDKEKIYKGNSENQSIYGDTNNAYYYRGQEDDDDFETVVVLAKVFDLNLIKYISAVNGVNTNRRITVNTSNPNKIVYDVSKTPIVVQKGDYVTYTFRIYNEGEISGYAEQITEEIPDGLEFVTEGTSEKDREAIAFNETNGWLPSPDGKKVVTDNLSKANGSESNLIAAYNPNTMTEGPHYLEVSVMLKVTAENGIVRNEAAITDDVDEDGNEVTDRDSKPEEWKKEDSDEYYENNPSYPKYKDDDEDYDNIKIAKFDLALRKFISAVSKDGDFTNTSTTKTYNRAPVVDSSKLGTVGADGKVITDATYTHSKEPVDVKVGDYVLYTIRVYNEGDFAGYAREITDYLPEGLDFVTGTKFDSINSNWIWDATTRKATTKSTAPIASEKINKFDGTTLSYKDIQIICKVNEKAITNATNNAEISKYAQDKDGVITEVEEDIDSTPNNYPTHEDDDDSETIKAKEVKFDLSLKKFLSNVSGKEVTSRIPKVSKNDGKITYTNPSDVVKVTVGDVVTFTLRVYNEGNTAGYAETVTDKISNLLEYLPDNSTNKEYMWKMYDKDGKETTKVEDAVKVVTDYTSKANGEKIMADKKLSTNPNLLNAFDPNSAISDDNPDFIDVKVAFKVKDPISNKIVITNKAEISEDADENGNPVKDIDSTPDNDVDDEDDLDKENLSVEYFDLSVLKCVTKVTVTENGKTTTTNTGNSGTKSDIIPKIEVDKKKINKTTIKFEYTIKVTNEGDIPGFAKEIKDYVPEGLKFYTEDNSGWKDEGNNVISTKLLENKLLQPGESATVTVVLRWINDSNNFQTKTNVAEISEDYNEKNVPDRDSTPNNRKEGEDDMDEAPVLIGVKTGMLENPMMFIGGGLVILTVLGTGVILIKRFVL